MAATNQFFLWFLYGFGGAGLGGWFLFFLLAVAGVAFILYHSSAKKIAAPGWKLAAILTACLMIPVIIFRFSSDEVMLSLANFSEVIFYLGVLGGVLPPVVAVGYLVTFRGEGGAQAAPMPAQMIRPAPAAPAPAAAQAKAAPVRFSNKAKANAWLAAESGRSYQLYKEVTTVGRSTDNDIQFDADTTISKQHAKIIERDDKFWLHDLASTNGTKVNERPVRQPVLLESGDVILFGDNTRVQFVKTER